MRNFYLYEDALKLGSISALEQGLNSLNNLIINRNEELDYFFCNSTIWVCDTTHGYIYDFYSGIVNDELQRIIPFIFSSFDEQSTIYTNHSQLDGNYPNDCNAFIGFEFSHTAIQPDRQVFDWSTYILFIKSCLKFGVIADSNAMLENLQMLYPSFVFSNRSAQESLNWKNSNRGLYLRLFDLLDDIPENPFTGGIGETEVLKYMSGVASKRINLANRLTYKLENNTTTILACSGHYN